MKKSIKKLLLCGLITTITLSSSLTALAGTWKQDNIGWWWQEDNGSYPVSAWKEISGKWYYFESSGYMAANKWIGNYYVGSDGAMLVNTTTPDGYKVGPDGAWIPETKVQNTSNQFQLNSQVSRFINATSYEEAIAGLNNVSQEWSGFGFSGNGYQNIYKRISADNLSLKVDWAYQKPVEVIQGGFRTIDAPEVSYGLHEIYGMMNEVFDGLTKDSYTLDEIEGLVKKIGATNIKSRKEDSEGYLAGYYIRNKYVSTSFTLGDYEYFLDTVGKSRFVYKPAEDQVTIRRIYDK